MDTSVRTDKWLWAVRLFKTRSLASDACRNGKVLINDVPVKPSRDIRMNDILILRTGAFRKTVKVTGIIANRVSAKLAAEFVEDITPPEEYEKLKSWKDDFFVKRDRGTGRPTKKDKRDIDNTFPEW